MVWYSHPFKNFPQFFVIHTVQGFCIVNEPEVDAFLEFPCFFYDLTNVDNLISGISTFSISSLYILKFLVHILLKPSLKDFEYCFASIWNESNWMVVWTFFGIAFVWYWKFFFLVGGCGKFLKRWAYQTTLPASWEICMQVKKQQLELNVEQQTGSKSGKQ